MSPKPKRALIAYCALASRLSTPGVGPIQALMPFLAEATSRFAGELFEAEKFSIAVADAYGLRIPRLAALGLAEQLCTEGLLTEFSRRGASIVYKYADQAPEHVTSDTSVPINENEVEAVLQSFVSFCRTDRSLDSRDDESLQQSLLDRLLNVDSMRILSRREASIAAKKTANTLTVSPTPGHQLEGDNQELHLDFLVSRFLLDLRDKNPGAFEQVSNVAFANMAAEAIACFREPMSEAAPLESLTVYLDSPLLLDMLGVNSEYEEYGRELLEAIKSNSAKPAVLDHCIVEAEAAVHAQLTHLRSGINQLSSQWGYSAKPEILSALIDNVAARTESTLEIEVQRDPDISLHRRAANTVGDIEAEMDRRMAAWRNADAKDHDRKSVWSMISIRESEELARRVCDSKWLLLTRNTALVSIANDAWATWLEGVSRCSRSSLKNIAPIALSDKQFAGYLWARKGGSDGAISKARLLAHCSAAVRPRADVKSRAYNLVLELNGKVEAEHLAALLEDREGAKALMSATQGDPENVTTGRLSFILEQVKLAAGEFAAEKAREESKKEFEAQRSVHEKEMESLIEKTDAENATKDGQIESARQELIQKDIERQQLEQKNSLLKEQLIQNEKAEQKRRRSILSDGFNVGCRVYKAMRWGLAALFGLAVYSATVYSASELGAGAVLIGFLGFAGFSFVPGIFEPPFFSLANRALKMAVAMRDSTIEIPTAPRPDFKSGSWELENITISLSSAGVAKA